MTAKNLGEKQEPFLNTVARKLGHAAGTLTNVAQELTENLSALPEAVSTKMRQTATGTHLAAVRTRHPKKKTARRAAGSRKLKATPRIKTKKPKSARNKSARRRGKSINKRK
jgi:hypothetical protein